MLSALLRPTWAMLAVLVLLASAGAAAKAWSLRGDHDAALQAKVVAEMQKKVDEQRARGDQLAADLETERQNIKTVTVEVIKKVPEVTTVYVENPGDAPKPIPDAVFTRGFVGLWNDAYAQRVRPGASFVAGAPAGADALVRARVTEADILDNHAINAGKWAECRSQLNALIDFETSRRDAPSARP